MRLRMGATLRDAKLAYKTYGSLAEQPAKGLRAAGGGENPTDTEFIDAASRS